MFLIWLIWFCAIDIWMLIPNYVPHQQHELSWNLSWTDLGLSLTLMTTLLRTRLSSKHLKEETRLSACVFSVRGARPVRVCVTPPGSEQAPSGLLEDSSLPGWGKGWRTSSSLFCLAAISRLSLLDPHTGCAAGTSQPQSRPDSSSARPQGAAVAQPGRPLAGVAAELRIILSWGTLSREQSPHPSSLLPAFHPRPTWGENLWKSSTWMNFWGENTVCTKGKNPWNQTGIF